MTFYAHYALGIFAHSQVNCKKNHYILQLPGLNGLTCFDIAHNKQSIGLFSTLKNKLQQAKSTKTSHPLCNKLCEIETENNAFKM